MSRFSGLSLDNLDLEDLVDLTKIGKLLGKKEEEVVEEKKCRAWLVVLAIIGVITVGAAIGYFIYQYFKPDYLEDFEDEFEDDAFDDEEDFFEDDTQN